MKAALVFAVALSITGTANGQSYYLKSLELQLNEETKSLATLKQQRTRISAPDVKFVCNPPMYFTSAGAQPPKIEPYTPPTEQECRAKQLAMQDEAIASQERTVASLKAEIAESRRQKE